MSDSSLKIGSPAQPCGHDHSAVFLGANTIASHDRVYASFALAIQPASVTAAAPDLEFVANTFSTRTSAPQFTHSAPLRI
jgi:hypothetical protein